jgi:hypothetical protein
MSTQAFIVTKGGIIVVETVVSPAAAVSALSNAARQIADDAARMADAWKKNSTNLNEFVGMAFQGDDLGGFKVIGAAAFGTAAALTAPAWLGLTATTEGAVAISVAAGYAAGKFYEEVFDSLSGVSRRLSGSISPPDIKKPIAVATRDFFPAPPPAGAQVAPDGVMPLNQATTVKHADASDPLRAIVGGLNINYRAYGGNCGVGSNSDSNDLGLTHTKAGSEFYSGKPVQLQ